MFYNSEGEECGGLTYSGFIKDSTGAKRLAFFVDAANQPHIVVYDGQGKVMREMGL